MSEIDAKISAVLARLDSDIERVTKNLDPILQSASVSELSEAETDPKKKAAPYALSAYALSSMLFAYLRSEGKDTAIVLPELARVKERLEKLSAPPASAVQEGREQPDQADKAEASPAPSERSGSSAKASGKHTRFDEKSEGPKKTRKTKARRL